MSWSSNESDESDKYKYKDKYRDDRDYKSRTRKRRYPDMLVDSSKRTRHNDDHFQPQMLSFKQFLVNQDDGIDDAAAKTKYEEYKDTFQKKVISDFFEDHKNEEWFRQKYHPRDSVTARTDRIALIKERLKTFTWLSENDWISSVCLEIGQSEKIIKLMDLVDHLLDGGAAEDAKEHAHKQAIFFRAIRADITKKEVDALGRQYDGYVRSCLHDPVPGGWTRRTWMTFSAEANLKDTCWDINQLRLKDCELSGMIEHKTYVDRVRSVSPNSLCSRVVRADVELCGQLIGLMDGRWGLWEGGNPLLGDLEEFLVETDDFDRLERLGLDTRDHLRTGDVARVDGRILGFLDRLVLYLRIVHSIDYYKGVEYPHEDLMPSKCLNLHVRPSDFTITESAISESVLEEWLAERRRRVDPLVRGCRSLGEEEALRAGLRDEASAVDKFLKDNTMELALEKFLCPLSGKKFKGPEFVHKHIFNKYGDKIEECKEETAYFNNYIRDPFRPSLPANPKPLVDGKRREGRRNCSNDPRALVDYSSLAPCDMFDF